MGAGLAVSPIDSDFLEKVKDYYAGDGADLVVEAASVWPAIKTSMDIVGAGGNVVVVARHTDRPDFNPMGHPYLTQQITLMTPKGMERGGQRWDYAHCVSLTLDMMASGRMNIMPMITNRLDWHQLPETYERLDKGDLDMVGVALQWPD
jgi:threonine dehydrogenase-like Zn-dependent dehydrogenase